MVTLLAKNLLSLIQLPLLLVLALLRPAATLSCWIGSENKYSGSYTASSSLAIDDTKSYSFCESTTIYVSTGNGTLGTVSPALQGQLVDCDELM